MLDAVDHLDALVDRLAGRSRRTRTRRPPSSRPRRCGCVLPPTFAVVDERRLRGVVRPLVVRHLLLPPLHLPGREVDGDQRVGARVRAGAERREVERRRRAGAEVERVRRRCRRSSASRRRRRRRASRAGASSVPSGGIVQNGFGQAGVRSVVVRHHEAADAVLGAGGADDQRGGSRRSARSSRSSRSSTTRPGTACAIATRRSACPFAGFERDDRHVERQHEERAVAVARRRGSRRCRSS